MEAKVSFLPVQSISPVRLTELERETKVDKYFVASALLENNCTVDFAQVERGSTCAKNFDFLTGANDEQRRLVAHLFDNPRYDSRVRPIGSYKEPINVTFRFNLYQIVTVVRSSSLQYVSYNTGLTSGRTKSIRGLIRVGYSNVSHLDFFLW